MRTIWAIAATLTVYSAASVSANAQSPTPWAGFYFGGSAGFASASTRSRTTSFCSPGAPFSFRCPNLPVVEAAWSGTKPAQSAIAGVHAGYTFQSGAFVAGVEADVTLWSIRARRVNGGTYIVAPFLFPFTTETTVASDWVATVRGRFGYVVGNALIYVAGGAAISEIRVGNAFRDGVPLPAVGMGDGLGKATKLGWTVGAGAEWLFAQNWSLRAEYFYVDFGSGRATGQVFQMNLPNRFNSPTLTSVTLTNHVVRIGASYRF